MKILIITYSREVNPGTFLQAYGVQYKLKELFPKAQIDLISHERMYSAIKGVNKKKNKLSFLKSKLKALPRRIKYEYLYSKCFSFSKQKFNLFNYNQSEFKFFAESYDLIVVGSDTILIDLKKEKGQLGLMWLEDIETNRILFSASSAPAKYCLEDDEKDRLRRNFDDFLFLGIRDNITKELLEKRIGVSSEVYRMPDPTFLIPNSVFKEVRTVKKKAKGKKIVLVNFNNDFQYKSIITEKLKSLDYFVISTLYNRDADYNVMTLDPFQWGGLFKDIDLVITERFHDTVFSLRNEKLVYVLDWDPGRYSEDGKSKASDLLDYYEMSNSHFIIKNDEDLDIFLSKIDNLNEIFVDTKKINKVNELQKQTITNLANTLIKIEF